MRKTSGTLLAGTLCFLAGCGAGNQGGTTGGQGGGSTNPGAPAVLTVTTTSLPAGTVGTSYNSAIIVVGGTSPYTFSAVNLPGGLSIGSATGSITGTPASNAAGTASATIKVTDSSQPSPQSASSTLSITIHAAAAAPSLTITTTSLPGGTAGTAYPATTLTANGGTGSYKWTLASGTSLPAGLTLSAAGVISGTPTTAGNTNFSVTVTDTTTPTPLTQTAALSIAIAAAAAPPAPPTPPTPPTPPSPPSTSQCSNMSTGNGASLNGFVPFPATDLWNTNIASAAVDPNSAAIISGLSGSHLHPDFSNVVDGNYGIPYVVVDSSTTAPVPVDMNMYASESDVTLYPIPASAPIEGFPPACTLNGDDHVLVIDKNKCFLYETWQSELCSGSWTAANGAVWDLTITEHRPYGWTSADAAGLPIFPGLVRYDEVSAGAIKHAIRMTLQHTLSDANGGYFVAPATHAAGNNSSTKNIMGMRLRLKASFDVSSYSTANQVILTAMKNYGLIVADNGSNLYFQGSPDARWDDDDLNALKAIDASQFEVIQMGTAYDDNTAPTGQPPTISSFTASDSNVAAGTQVTLNWTVANDSYDYIDVVGVVRGTSQVVTPTATTTYTLNSTNQYGRSTQSVTVSVH